MTDLNHYILVFSISILNIYCQQFSTGENHYVGCFLDNSYNRDLGTRASGLTRVNVTTCINWCEDHYYKYAGLQQGSQCWCGPSFGKHGPGTCDATCPGGDTCGGDTANSVYMTQVRVPGPPTALMVTEVTDTSVQISWEPPESPNGEIQNYKVVLHIAQSHNKYKSRVTDKVLEMSGTSRVTRVGDLLSGSQYNISVMASTGGEDEYGPGVSVVTWTSVGVPDTPRPPVVLSWDKHRGRMRVRVEQVEDNGGRVRFYQLIVAEGQHPSLHDAPLYTYKEAEAEGHGYWIAAQVTPQYLTSHAGEVTLGDNQLYGGYLNYGPLNSVQGYGVAVAVTQTLNGQSRTSVSDLVTSKDTGDNIVLRVHDDGHNNNFYSVKSSSTQFTSSRSSSGSSSTLTTLLVVGVVVGGLLLAIAIIIFVVLRRRVGSPLRRSRSDTQELTSQQNNVGTSTSPATAAVAAYSQENDEILASELDFNLMKAKTWMIPKNFVDVSGEVLGRGRFGSVFKGQVQANGRVMWCNTQHVSMSGMTRAEYVSLLVSLDTSIRAGTHPHITSLVGMCEEMDTLVVVMDQAQPSLKQFMLDSRALEHCPDYASNYNRYSTAREEAVLEIITGITDGLKHLADRGVGHSTINYHF